MSDYGLTLARALGPVLRRDRRCGHCGRWYRHTENGRWTHTTDAARRGDKHWPTDAGRWTNPNPTTTRERNR